MAEKKTTDEAEDVGTPVNPLSNDIKPFVKQKVDEITALKAERGEVNANIKAAMEALEAKGVKKEATRMAMRYMEWDEAQRQGFDLAYAIVREALGLPLQVDFFNGEGAPAAKPPSETVDAPATVQ